jgi:hypothetical protein
VDDAEEGMHMTDTSRPFAEKKFTEVKGHRMAYIDEGEGAPIVFQPRAVSDTSPPALVVRACMRLKSTPVLDH